MRRQGSGWVIQLSSVGGQITAPGFGAYCATKFALEGLTQTLSQEVPGVHFLIVEPGAFRTGLFGKDAAYFSAPDARVRRNGGTDPHLCRDRRRFAGRGPGQGGPGHLTAMSSAKPPLAWSSARTPSTSARLGRPSARTLRMGGTRPRHLAGRVISPGDTVAP